MRVLFNTAGIFNKHTAIRNEENSTIKNSTAGRQILSSYLSVEFFKANYLQQNLNFRAGSRIRKKSFPLTRYHDYISCPCCGEKMINTDKEWQDRFAKETADKKGKALAAAIRNNIHEFQPSKRDLALFIAANALKYKDKNASEILEKISFGYIDSLQGKQITILNDMANELKIRKKNKIQTIQNWYFNQIDRMKNAKEEHDFKNRDLVRSFSTLAHKLKINIDDKKIQAYFDKLPNSKRDIDAFVIKYQRRPPEETIKSMLKNTTCTLEHIVPFCKTEDNNFKNIILMCSDCNNARGNTNYREFLKLYPEMQENIKKYFKDIEELLNNKITKQSAIMEYRSYIKNVSRTLEIYTKGELSSKNSNTSRHTKQEHCRY